MGHEADLRMIGVKSLSSNSSVLLGLCRVDIWQGASRYVHGGMDDEIAKMRLGKQKIK